MVDVCSQLLKMISQQKGMVREDEAFGDGLLCHSGALLCEDLAIMQEGKQVPCAQQKRLDVGFFYVVPRDLQPAMLANFSVQVADLSSTVAGACLAGKQ